MGAFPADTAKPGFRPMNLWGYNHINARGVAPATGNNPAADQEDGGGGEPDPANRVKIASCRAGRVRIGNPLAGYPSSPAYPRNLLNLDRLAAPISPS